MSSRNSPRRAPRFNPVAKHAQQLGPGTGFHGRSRKAERRSAKIALQQRHDY